MQFWRTSKRPMCGTTKYQKRGIRSTSAPPIRMNVYGRRGGVAGVASVTSSGQRSDRDISGASSPARGRRARRPQQPRGTVSPPSGVLRTPHSRPSDERPHRHPAPVKDGGSGSRNTRTARFWRTSKLPACAGIMGRRDRERPIKEKKSAPVNVYGRCGCVAVGLEGVSNRGGTVSAPAGVLRTP